MRKMILPLLSVIPMLLYGQTDLKKIATTSHQAFAYRIAATLAEKYIVQDSIDVDAYVNQTPAAVFPVDSVDETMLPIGHYVILSVVDNRIFASVTSSSNLFVYPLNNQHSVQLLVRNKQGEFIENAKVWVNKKQAFFDAQARSYRVAQKDPDMALVKVYAPNDSLFLSLSAEDELDKTVLQQRWTNFTNTRLVRAVTWLPGKIAGIFKKRRRYNTYRAGTPGSMIFNQPKFKQTDTVKLKAYVFNKNWRRYNKPVKVTLEYNNNGRQVKQLLTVLKPAAPGAYVYQFPLNDTLDNDVNYTVAFNTINDKRLITKNFEIEDYVLDEVAKYGLRSAKDTYYPGDTMHFYATATDANGLPLLDGKAQLTLFAVDIDTFYKDSMYIPDTLFKQEKPLLAQGETTFAIPANIAGDGAVNMKAVITFINGNNELHEEEKEVSFSPAKNVLTATADEDSVFADYRVNGISVSQAGIMKTEGGIAQMAQVQFPFKAKIDPAVEKYTFIIKQNGVTVNSITTEVSTRYQVRFRRVSASDSVAFSLDNPFAIPVSFTVFDGNKIVGMGGGSAPVISWAMKTRSPRKMYRVKWQYLWHNEEQSGEQTIAVLYKLLNINVKGAASVFPGQTDTIRVDVKDFKNNAAANVNLTAVSYNSQFSRDIRVPDPPYLAKYRLKQLIKRDKYEQDDAYMLEKYPLSLHKAWIKNFGLDSMPWYQMLFPAGGSFDGVTQIAGFVPQVSVNMVRNGERQRVYMLYINRRLVYYYGATDSMVYAFATYNGYVQLGIRLRDKYIQVDSVYVQPSYKHDLVFDVDSLPANSVVETRPAWLTTYERNQLEGAMWQLDNSYTTNNGYIWQGQTLVHLQGSNKHISGPFSSYDSMHFYAPGRFDINFRFEPGYEYNLSNKVLRLEKKKIFPDTGRVLLPAIKSPTWIIGDTIIPPPEINYTLPPPKRFYLNFTDYYATSYKQQRMGNIIFTVPRDTVLEYVVLYDENSSRAVKILQSGTRSINNIKPGIYSLLLVNKMLHVAYLKNLQIKADTTLCYNTGAAIYENQNSILSRLFYEAANPKREIVKPSGDSTVNVGQPAYGNGTAKITGKIFDKKGGLPIAFAAINIKGTRTGVAADANGNFILANIKEGTCTLLISAVAYQLQEVMVNALANSTVNVNIFLQPSSSQLSEVVVVGYAAQRKKEITGSVSIVRDDDLSQALQGKVAGVQISQEGTPGSNIGIQLRGASSINSGEALYVIDGVAYTQMPANISPDMIASISILKDAEATGIYGMRAAGGVVVITTKTKTQRTLFRDYAFWQPQLFTDANGHAQFAVTYPDNVTGWQTYVLGMDKHGRMGKTVQFIQSYKPLLAQLSMPQFLLGGDTAELVGKALNYTNDAYTTSTTFSIGGVQAQPVTLNLSPKASIIQSYKIIAPAGDTLNAGFSLQTSTGFKDGEERKIPVFKPGTEETTGRFWVLKNDTTVSFTAGINNTSVELYAQNNTLDILLNDIEYLDKYPYYCMEQTSSKLRGLLMKKKISEALHKPFDDDKTINSLLERLQKNQLFDGGWAWWPDGKPDLFITNYVIKALLPLRTNPMVETNIRNGLLYLQNQLTQMNRDQLLGALLTMCEAHHLFDYQPWLQKIKFDSLSMQQQWQYVKIKQLLAIDHTRELDTLLKKAIPGMLGSIHWGEDNYRWYGDANATTVLAFETLQQEKGYDKEMNGMMQYFLEQHKQGYWVNTVTSASIVSAVLPYILAQNNAFEKPARLDVSGDTAMVITQYPFKANIGNNVQKLNINKTGGGLTYLTLYQHFFNPAPQPVTKDFVIETYFEKNSSKVTYLTSGEKVKMIVHVNALKEAEYVMMEIPIPAGCLYGSKQQDAWNMHKEFLKNKVVMFAEYLSKGDHTFEIELESRYNGTYTLNPAKASLMYFPTFYGRNGMKKVEIRK